MKKSMIRIALILGGVIVLVPAVTAFLPRTFVLEREVVINRPKDQVFDFVRRMENQKKYSVWARLDPNVKTAIRGSDGDVGAVYSWERADQNVGAGEQEITGIRAGERIDFEIRMARPFQSSDPVFTLTEAAGESQTRVRSIYHGKLNYPTNLLCSIVCGKVGDDMQASLLKLKDVLEQPAADPGSAP